MKDWTWKDVVSFYPLLAAVEGLRHAFLGRIPGVDVQAERAEALARLAGPHEEIRRMLRWGDLPLVTAEQVHGAEVGVVEENAPLPPASIAGVDALVTRRRDVVLGIYVADCAAVYLVDPVQKAIGLVHSGRKGTELGIVVRTIRVLQERFGTKTQDLIVQVSPCIRPPFYEVDFAAEIARQAKAVGVRHFADGGLCTARDPARYYSYRMAKGRTGRMLALLAWPEDRAAWAEASFF